MDQALAKKMGISKYRNKLLLNLPENVDVFDGLDFDTNIEKGKYDLIIDFVFSVEEMRASVQKTADLNLLNKNGYHYMAYPKKGNKLYDVYIHRDSIFPELNIDDADGIFNGTNLKFSRMMALDGTFTLVGLKCI